MKKTCLPKIQNSSCFRLFSWHTIVFVLVSFLTKKHMFLIYKDIEVYYKQNQNDGTRFGTHHVSLLSHVCQDKAQHTDFQDG